MAIQEWTAYRHLFPRLPERARFNRRRRNLMGALNQIRQLVLMLLDVAQAADGAIDSIPLPVMHFHLAPQRTRGWDAHGATFGYCASKKQVFFGYRLHLVGTFGGVILDFELTAANADERDAAADMLPVQSGRTFLADKGDVQAPLAELLAACGGRLIAARRVKQRVQLPDTLGRLVKRFRQIIETVNGQLTDQLRSSRTLRTVSGVCVRACTRNSRRRRCVCFSIGCWATRIGYKSRRWPFRTPVRSRNCW